MKKVYFNPPNHDLSTCIYPKPQSQELCGIRRTISSEEDGADLETTVVEKEEKLVVSVDEDSELNASVEDTIERAADVSSLEVRNDDSSSLDLEASAETTLDSFKTETSDEDNEESGPDERKVDECEKTAVYSDFMRPVKVKAHVVS